MTYRIIDSSYGMEDGDPITANTLKKILQMFYGLTEEQAERVVDERDDGLYECDVCVAVPNE